jgi:hypothetical protein
MAKSRPTPVGHAPPSFEYIMDDFPQLPINDYHHYRDPENFFSVLFLP